MYVEKIKRKKVVVCLFAKAFGLKSFFFSESKNILSKLFYNET